MFIARNGFHVKKDTENKLRTGWLSRTVPGFVEFHLLKRPEDYTPWLQDIERMPQVRDFCFQPPARLEAIPQHSDE